MALSVTAADTNTFSCLPSVNNVYNTKCFQVSYRVWGRDGRVKTACVLQILPHPPANEEYPLDFSS